MSLTTKQREALQALADVMQEHDITFTSSEAEYSRSIGVGRYLVYTSHSVNPIDASDITKLLQEQ